MYVFISQCQWILWEDGTNYVPKLKMINNILEIVCNWLFEEFSTVNGKCSLFLIWRKYVCCLILKKHPYYFLCGTASSGYLDALPATRSAATFISVWRHLWLLGLWNVKAPELH